MNGYSLKPSPLNMKVELDLPNYAIKADFKNEIDIDT